MSRVVDGDVLPVVERRTDDREGGVRLTLAIDGIENLFLRPAAVVVRSEHVVVAPAGDNSGAFHDAEVAHPSEQPDTRRDFLTEIELGGMARGQRRDQQ